MIKIIGLPTSHTKKLNLLGIDFSVAYAKQWQVLESPKGVVPFTRNIFYVFNSNVEYDTITYRLILWRLKFEVKTITRSSYAFS